MAERFGFWAALAAFAAAVLYGVPQLMQVAGILVWPWDLILIFTPSLVLAPCFVLAMVALHVATAPERAVWSLSALSLAILYGAWVGLVYVVQIGTVIPLGLGGEGEAIALFACCDQHRPLTAIDLLGYTTMSLATLFGAGAIAGGGIGRATRIAFLLNGALAPFLILQLYYPGLIVIGALWLLTFPAAMVLLALAFRRGAP